MNILVTGGCGYIGSRLVPHLMGLGHEVQVVDIGWFGFNSEADGWEADVRTFPHGYGLVPDTIIHLASVANDVASDLNPDLSWDITVNGTLNMARLARECGARLIYASSGSVYGVHDGPAVETTPMYPISTYNRAKMTAENLLLDFDNVTIVRPATVCGLSPRMRFDVLVNMFVAQAMKGKITVWGGQHMRPHIHMDDMIGIYEFLLDRPSLNGAFNAGFENYTVLDISKMVSHRIPCDVEVTESSDDPRSYMMDSSKILEAGFSPTKGVSDAIEELAESDVEEAECHHNVRWMKSQGIANA